MRFYIRAGGAGAYWYSGANPAFWPGRA